MPSGISLGTLGGEAALFVADYEGGAVKQYLGLDGDKVRQAARPPLRGGFLCLCASVVTSTSTDAADISCARR